ncbi:rod shape-determining protein MreD [Loktanella sp. SALINAS62]|uniref:rod shape-determining protein MreD n=1 Tax=Loktanella sp. SALINAS62 TaxID=2706124 RepID=UPI001B8BFDDF|nr:rod shape-determining protein MreD [Loktanella sp. SALINAS62]MBS1304058.1 rod shape-determining protein MreD [Loktanella sp. SALINAS62]
MAETPTSRIWGGRLKYLGLAAAIMFVQLLPLGAIPAQIAGPDFLLVVTLAYAARRPEYLQVGVVIAVFLLADLLFQRPPGLWAAFVCILSEMLRKRSKGLRNVPLLLEWATVSLGILAITLGYRLVLTVTLVPQAPLGLTLMQMLMTMAAYPIVVLIAQFFFGLSRPAPGQVDSFGHKL